MEPQQHPSGSMQTLAGEGSPQPAKLTALHACILGLLAAAGKPLQTADIRKLAHLTTIEARDACLWLFQAGLVSQRVRVVPVTARSRLVRQRRAFWAIARGGREALKDRTGQHQ